MSIGLPVCHLNLKSSNIVGRWPHWFRGHLVKDQRSTSQWPFFQHFLLSL